METSETKAIIAEYVKRARVAQKAIDSYSQKQVDALVRAVAKAIYDNAEYLARLAVDETRMGVYEDKVTKNKGKAKVIYNSLKGVKSVGVIRCRKDCMRVPRYLVSGINSDGEALPLSGR